MYDVLVIGGAGVDTIVNVPELPMPYSDAVMTPGIRDFVGHTGNGVALGCRALGLRVKLVDFLGDDLLGELVRTRLAAADVDTAWLPAATTRRAVNLVDARGRRMSFYDGEDAPGTRMPEAFLREHLTGVRHVHVSIMDFARHAYPLIDGVTVSTDLHVWDGDDEYQRDFAHQSDLVFLSAERLGDRVPDVMRQILEKGRAQAVVATAGENGGHFLTREQDEVRSYPVAEGGPIIDSNGAGDAFVSGFLHTWLAGGPVAECVRRGAIAGRHACGAAGTHQALITGDELLTL